MIDQLIFIVIASPLFTALITGMFGFMIPSFVRVISFSGLLLGGYSAFKLFKQVLNNGPQSYYFGNWGQFIKINPTLILKIFVIS